MRSDQCISFIVPLFFDAHSVNFLSVSVRLLGFFGGFFFATAFGFSTGFVGHGALGANTVFTLGFLAVVRVALVESMPHSPSFLCNYLKHE
jgi:hypothetical protein